MTRLGRAKCSSAVGWDGGEQRAAERAGAAEIPNETQRPGGVTMECRWMPRNVEWCGDIDAQGAAGRRTRW